MFARIRNSWLLTKAIAAVKSGKLTEAERYLKRTNFDGWYCGLVYSLLAYVYLIKSDRSAALRSISVSSSSLGQVSNDERYIAEYNKYLSAVLSNDKTEYRNAWTNLQGMPCSQLVKDALALDPLAPGIAGKSFQGHNIN